MLRLFGAVCLTVLIVGPVLEQTGFLTNAGLFREFILLEMRAIDEFIAFVRVQIRAGV